MFGDVGQARTNAAMLLMMIATTSSRTCTKPTVIRLSSSSTIYFSVNLKANKFVYFKKVKMCILIYTVLTRGIIRLFRDF